MSKVMKMLHAVVLICLAAIFCNALVMGQPAAPQAAAPAAPATAAVLRGHRSGLTAVEFSPDGAWLASSSLDGTLRLWSTSTWNAVRIFNHGSEICAIAFSPDGHLLVSGGYDNRLMFWEMRSGKLRRAVKLPDWPVGITFTPTGQLVAGCSDGLVRLLDPTGVIKGIIDTEHEIMSLAVSPDGRYLATGFPIKLWDLAARQLLSNAIRGWGDHGLAFTPSGDRLASAEGIGGALILSVPAGEILQRLRLNVEKQMFGPSASYSPVLVNMPATAVAFSRDGAQLATGGSNSAVQLWKIPGDAVAPANQTPARVLTGHTMTVTGVSFSPDGRHLASASLDRTVRVWELR